MIIIYPNKINWFYEERAIAICSELRNLGFDAKSVPSNEISAIERHNGIALILSMWESVTSAEWQGVGEEFLRVLRTIDRRILVNYDCIFSQYFDRHFVHDDRLVTEIFDICMAPQTDHPYIRSVPYTWVPEAFSASDFGSIQAWSHDRKIPWSMIGHGNRERASLAAAVARIMPTHGFVFLPPVRPYDERSGLGHKTVLDVLRQSDLYIWGSHHSYPYHEGLRALHAVFSGAAPAKIDPMHWKIFEAVPWVYPSVEALSNAVSERGVKSLYAEAKDFILSHKSLGNNIVAALSRRTFVGPVT